MATLSSRYDRLVKSSRISDDPAQREVLALLEDLAQALEDAGRRGIFKKQAATAKSLYIWGAVGRGKSMLMDLFFERAPLANKRRVHFHAFMQDVHARIHDIRQKGGGDPVAVLAQQLAKETSLLCFDELQATDVADATLLFRLFDGLFAAGITIVSTSNRPPAELYTGGVQAERFNRLIALIEERMQVAALDAPQDYRQSGGGERRRVYVHPLGLEANRFIAGTLERLCPGAPPHNETITVQGRDLPCTFYGDAIGRFTFQELCAVPLGPADYLALAGRLDTLILTGIPRLPAEQRNEAKRFVTLVDALYEHKVKCYFTAEGPPEAIYAHGDGAFEFQRTVSRLREMQSEKWMKR